MSSIPSHTECVAAVKYQHSLDNPDYQYNNISEREACVERELLIGIQTDIHERLNGLMERARIEVQKPDGEYSVTRAKNLKIMIKVLSELAKSLGVAIDACNNALTMQLHSAVWAAIPEGQLRHSARHGNYDLVKEIVDNIHKAVNDAIARASDTADKVRESYKAAVRTLEDSTSTVQTTQDSPEDIRASRASLVARLGNSPRATIPDPNATVPLPRPKIT